MFFLLSDDKNFIDKIFNCDSELIVNLNDDVKKVFKSKDDDDLKRNLSRYVHSIFDFFDPLTAVVDIKPLLKYSLNNEDGSLFLDIPKM